MNLLKAGRNGGRKVACPKAFPPLSRCRPLVAIPGKGVRCQWGQFGMRASPCAPPNIELAKSWIYIWTRTQTMYMEVRRDRTYGTFVHSWHSPRPSNRPYINISNANSLWSTDSPRIVFGCLPYIRRTAECCLPHLDGKSTLNNHFVFTCRICVRFLFAFRCKPGFTHDDCGETLILQNDGVLFCYIYHSSRVCDILKEVYIFLQN